MSFIFPTQYSIKYYSEIWCNFLQQNRESNILKKYRVRSTENPDNKIGINLDEGLKLAYNF